MNLPFLDTFSTLYIDLQIDPPYTVLLHAAIAPAALSATLLLASFSEALAACYGWRILAT